MHKASIIFLTLIWTSTALAQDQLIQILNQDNWPSKNKFHIDFHDEDGNHSAIPIVVIKGEKEGPIFTILAGVHGFEYPPIIAAQELIQEIQPEQIIGTVIILPISNPNSFYSRTPFLNPQDKLNLNRVFPGNDSGSITERIAHYISSVVIANSDVLIDIHGGDAGEDLLPFVCYYNNEAKSTQTKKAKRLSEVSGFEYIVSYPYTLKDHEPAKYAFKQAVQDGKIALSIECGKLGNLERDAVEKIKIGIYNMLSDSKVLPKREIAKNEFTTLNRQAYIRSESKGVFHSNYSAGDHINKGDIVGTIKNDFGDIITEIFANESGVILYKIGTPPVNIGETIMCIGFSLK